MIDAIRGFYSVIERFLTISGLPGGLWTVLVAQLVVTRLAITVVHGIFLALKFTGDTVVQKLSLIRTAPDDLILKRLSVLARLHYEASTRRWRWPTVDYGPEHLAQRRQQLFGPRRRHSRRSITGWLVTAVYTLAWSVANAVTDLIRGLVGANVPNMVALVLVMLFGRAGELLQASTQWLVRASGPTPQAWIGFVLALLGVVSVVLSVSRAIDIRGVGEYGKQATAQAYSLLSQLLPIADDLAHHARELSEDLLDPEIEPETVELRRKALAEAWQRAKETVSDASSAYDQRLQLVRTAPLRARALLEHLLEQNNSVAEDLEIMRRPEAPERTFARFDGTGRILLVHSAHEPVRAPARNHHRRWIESLVRIDVEAAEYVIAVERRLNPGPMRRLLQLTGK
ncbi:hypothetical protein [Amycolatopsis dendrobii]|uniref:Uncharacterized protein n=1 Tax=Amycolatopsis dendrobii TaxID=2760662 RepID=A0A7W3W3I8_9PSEU|nr:hypothetical protein [Amycolatopsis dendrobii]MBB1158135.1 hypothetical protein [Amycolatopsis dendrobii]